MKLIQGLFIGQEVALPVVDNQVCGAAMGVNEVSKRFEKVLQKILQVVIVLCERPKEGQNLRQCYLK